MVVVLAFYILVAVASTIFHGFWCLDIWPIYGEKGPTTPQRIHSIWFNSLGSAAGWLLGYWEIWHRFLPASAGAAAVQALGLIDFALLILALLGMAGYLPNTLAGVSRAVWELGKKVAGGEGRTMSLSV